MRQPLDKHQFQVLAILSLVNFMNFVDRQIIGAILPLLQDDFSLSHSQAALLGTAFALMHSIFTLPLGMLADRTSRKNVMAAAVLFWSLATFVTGLARSFRLLLVARSLVGLGEAAFTPAATAIITRSFPAAVRARVQGTFNAGMFIGGCVGLGLGGALASSIGWRPTLFIVAIPGILLAWKIVSLHEPRVETAPRPVPLRNLLRLPAYAAAVVSGCFVTFSAYALIFWGTTFVVRHKGFGLGEAGLILGASLGVAGVLGIIVGAWLADRLMRRVAWGRVAVIVAGLALGIPFLVWAVHTPNRMVFLATFFTSGFFLSWYHGPLTAVLHDMTPERAHATAMGLYNAIVHLVAVTWAPLVIGAIADRWGLLRGMDIAAGTFVLGTLGFVVVLLLVRRASIVSSTSVNLPPRTDFREWTAATSPVGAAVTPPQSGSES
ncbi:MAG TPA: MFS transporter [Candidatus Krumholzibacteria bacterium]|nr:MFS transporter [Candidatus Krumholzibacteria bacterium]